MAEHTMTLPCGLRMAWRDLASQTDTPGPAVLCLHGLTRQSGDFATVFDDLVQRHRVIAPDLRGRGRSDADPDIRRYNVAQYADDILLLLDRLHLQHVVVIGTSLGGWVAAQMARARPGLFAGVVLNDIGPEIGAAGAKRVEASAANVGPFESWDAAVAATQALYAAALPDLDGDGWDWYTRQTFRELKPGHIELICDRGVGEAARRGLSRIDGDPWTLFDALCASPTLVLRGKQSDILEARTLDAMRARYSTLTCVTVPNRGHVPLLNEPEAHRALFHFLDTDVCRHHGDAVRLRAN